MNDSSLIRTTLASRYPAISRFLADVDLGMLCQDPGRHILHPLRWVIEGVADDQQNRSAVLGNTEMALRWLLEKGNPQRLRRLGERATALPHANAPFDDWYYVTANVAGALAELRAWGYLGLCGLNPTPRSSSGPDFYISVDACEGIVEVTAKLMDKAEAEKLAKFKSGLAKQAETVIYPAGRPKTESIGHDRSLTVETEFVVHNLAQRFAQKAGGKKNQVPGDRPSILWLDVQFEDWWCLTPAEAWPVYALGDGRFHTGGIWLAFYGKRDTPLMDFESICEGLPPETRGIKHKFLEFNGYFHSGEARASAVVISWPRCTVLFENPHASNPLPLPIIERLLQLRWFDWPRSWIRPFWKDQQTGLAELRQRVCLALDEIAGVAQVARLDW